MAHTIAGHVRAERVGTTSHTVDLASVANGETLILFWIDRTGGGVVNSVADEDGGTWTQRSTATIGGSNSLYRLYVRENATVNALLTITVTTNASQNSQLVAARVASDTGGGVYPTYDAVATVLNDNDNDTSFDSNTVAATAAGCIIGGMATGNAQNPAPTMDNGNESIGPASGATSRCWITFEATASSGNYGFQTTVSSPGNSNFHVISLIDSGGGGGVAIPIVMHHRRLMGC